MYDYDYLALNDHYSAQNLQNFGIGFTAGKMLGGSSSLNHMVYIRGFPHDYDQWAELLEDDSWNYENSIKYFKKNENIINRDLRASPYYGKYFGTNGMIDLTRESYPIIDKYLEAFREAGHKIENVTTMLGYADTIFTIDDGVRQSTSHKYLGKIITRTNLCMSLFTTATKILIEDDTAIGVEITVSNGEKYEVYANKEVIVCAGAIESPKLLMLSGIGPRAHLESLGIDVVVDLPVGQTFQDQPSAIIVYKMEKSSVPLTPLNPHKFGVPFFTGIVALESAGSADSLNDPDYLSFNVIVPHDAPTLSQYCDNIFRYSYEICQKMIEANKGRTLLFVVNSLLMPKSFGKILLASTDPSNDPLIYAGTFKNKSDLNLLAKSLKDYNKVINTTYFKSVNASMVDLGLCPQTASEDKFWECCALKMSTTTFHFGRSCAMGSVLDSSFQVKGVGALRVIDASSMPQFVRAPIYAAINMMAEHGADLILSAWNIKV